MPERIHTPTPDPAAPHRPRSAHHLLLFRRGPSRRTWWIAAGVALVLAIGVTLLFAFTELDWSQVRRAFAWIGPAMDRLNAAAVLPLMAVLPVFGFPIGVVYVVAGGRFGPWLGGAVVALITAVNLLLSHAIARTVLRGPLERLLAKRGLHLPHAPEDEHAAISLIAVLAPGIPYFLRNYLLALAAVRLRIYFWIAVPIYVARSYGAILLGNISSDPSLRALLLLGGIDVLKLVVCAFVIWRLREHHRKFHGHDAHEPPSAQAAGG